MKYTTEREIRDLTARIASASPVGLVVINYELLIGEIDGALEAGGGDDGGGGGEAFGEHLLKARGFLTELVAALDHGYELSDKLASLYIYVNKLLIEASRTGEATGLGEARGLLAGLLAAWRKVAEDTPDAATVTAYGRFGEVEPETAGSIGKGYTA